MECHYSSLTVLDTDLKAHVISSTIEQVYSAFFYSTSTYMLCQQSDEVLFGHFVTTLNAAFESKLTLEDKGYDSGSKHFNIPTPLRRSCKIHHILRVGMHPLTHIQSYHAALVPRNHTADQYADT